MRTEEEWMALRTENAMLRVELAASLERERVAQELSAQLSERLNKLEERMPSCRIHGYLSTLCKRGIRLLTALESVFLGHPLLPNHSPG